MHQLWNELNSEKPNLKSAVNIEQHTGSDQQKYLMISCIHGCHIGWRSEIVSLTDFHVQVVTVPNKATK